MAEQPDPYGFAIPFVNWLGLKLGHFQAGRSELHLEPQAQHMNSLHMVHGGVILTMMDVGMATAARSALRDDAAQQGETLQPRVITIELKTTFMKPCNGPLRVKGTCLSHSRSMAFCEAEVVDSHDRVCAKASGTFKYVKVEGPKAIGT